MDLLTYKKLKLHLQPKINLLMQIIKVIILKKQAKIINSNQINKNLIIYLIDILKENIFSINILVILMCQDRDLKKDLPIKIMKLITYEYMY